MECLRLHGPGIRSFMKAKVEKEGINVVELIKDKEAHKEFEVKCVLEYIEEWGQLDPY